MQANDSATNESTHDESERNKAWESQRAQRIKVKNRRKTYLDQNPDYFSATLELAGPLPPAAAATPAEREAEGRQKGYSGVLEADLMRSEAKLAALNHPESSAVTYRRDERGEIYAEDLHDDDPKSKEEGQLRWRREMTERFLRGDDADFDYQIVDRDEAWDDTRQEERDEEERWFTEEEPRWILNDDTAGRDDADPGFGNVTKMAEGETGIQDF
ncbi:MAG: hypothetical protein M1816_001429 [Peltula sp. TS41687]|nr:MAG: hypothetical protein M1816_001429 [Peltula sp. TS41687]